MKFWELVSAFRGFEKQLNDVLDSPKWKNPYGQWLKDFDSIVDSQDRIKLDDDVPEALTLEVSCLIGDSLVLYKGDGYLRFRQHDNADIKLNAHQVIQLYGGSVLEEVLEKSIVKVKT